MSRGLNKLQIIGHLGRDPEMRYTPEGRAVTNFSVAVSRQWKDREGNRQDETEWFNVDAWEKLAETCNQYLTKGSLVYIEGRIKTRKWTDQDGRERTSWSVIASEMVILTPRSGGGGDMGGDEEYSDEGAQAPRAAAPARSSAAAPAAAANRAPSAPGAARGGMRNKPEPMSDDDIPF